MLSEGNVWVISGPTTDDLPPFAFSGDYANVPHYGMPLIYNFDWVLYNATYANELINDNLIMS